jgi:hypothetical protein
MNYLKLLIFVIIFCSKFTNSFAYFGLGPLIPIIGSIFWFIIIFLIAFLGIFIKPLKGLHQRLRKKKNEKKDKRLSE